MSEKLIEITDILTINRLYIEINRIKRDEIALIDDSVFKDSLLCCVIADSKDTQSSVKRQILSLEADRDSALDKIRTAIRASSRTNFAIAKKAAEQALTKGIVSDNT